MRHSEPEPANAQGIFSSERFGAAVRSLTDPIDDPSGDPLRLTADRRDTIERAISGSSHPSAAPTEDLLDQWEQLDADERAAGLLGLADLIHPHPPTHRSHDGPTTWREIER